MRILSAIEKVALLTSDKERLMGIIPVKAMDMFNGKAEEDELYLNSYLSMINDYNNIVAEIRRLETECAIYDTQTHISKLDTAISNAKGVINYLKDNLEGNKARLRMQKDLLQSWEKERYELKKELLILSK